MVDLQMVEGDRNRANRVRGKGRSCHSGIRDEWYGMTHLCIPQRATYSRTCDISHSVHQPTPYLQPSFFAVLPPVPLQSYSSSVLRGVAPSSSGDLEDCPAAEAEVVVSLISQ
jgi:hypothetical protein